MYQNPTLFPAVTNRENWTLDVTLSDDDTGDAFDLTGATITLEVRRATESAGYGGGYGGYGRSEWDGGCYGSPRLTASIGSGITVTGTGVFRVDFTPTQMRSLSPGTYDVGCVITRSGDARQLFLGRLPVLFGGVT